MGIAKPQERVVEDVEHQPRLGAERPLRPVERHVILGPGHEPAALPARLCLAGPQADGRIVVLVKVALVDHPADHATQRRQQVAGLRRRARLHFCLDNLARQHRKWLLAILRQQALDQPGALEPCRVRQALMADAEIAEPVVALLVERPVPAQGVGLRRLARQFAARLIALFLRVDVVGRIAIKRDLRGDGRVTLVVEFWRAELGLDPDLRQSVAKLDIIARLSTLRAIGLHIAAFRLHQRIGFGTLPTKQWRIRRCRSGSRRCAPLTRPRRSGSTFTRSLSSAIGAVTFLVFFS